MSKTIAYLVMCALWGYIVDKAFKEAPLLPVMALCIGGAFLMAYFRDKSYEQQ